MGREPKLSPWATVVSGTSAAVIANTLIYPLDIAKTRLQVQARPTKKETDTSENEGTVETEYKNVLHAISLITKENGFSGLYDGMASSLLSTASMNFAYFYWCAAARKAHEALLPLLRVPNSNGLIKEFGIGAVGGSLAQLCTTPLAVISTQQQTRKAEDIQMPIWETLKDICRSDDGWSGLWRGFKVNLILVINPMITYGVYQWLRTILIATGRKIGSVETFLLGASSKVIATIATHPLIVAKAMIQSKAIDGQANRRFTGFTQVLAHIRRNEGYLRLYKGLIPQIIKGFLVQGLMMLFKERIELLVLASISFHKRQRAMSRKST